MVAMRLAASGVLVLGLAGFGPAAWPAERATLDAVSVHLFLETSGTLSADVTANEGFHARNFVPSGRNMPQDERFHDVLVRLRFTARTEIFAEGPQAELVVAERTSKKVILRRRIADLYVGSRGWTFVPVFLADVACKPLTVTATGGGKRIAKTLEFSCGE